MARKKKIIPSGKNKEEILKKNGYELGKVIGSGTFAKVRLARWTDGDHKRTIAVKVIDLLAASKDYQDKFLPRELDIWPKMTHSHIIRVYSTVTLGENLYVFMELAENGDIIEYLQKNGAAPEKTVRTWAGQLLQALQFCHKRGIAHRDVKCENLLLDRLNNLKLADFGFARICMDHVTHRRILSKTYCGSAAYVAPEVLRGMPYNPFRSDVWSVGICLFVMLNNNMPFDDTDFTKLYRRQLARKWVFQLEDQISQQGKDFIKKALEPDILKRPTLDILAANVWFKCKLKKPPLPSVENSVQDSDSQI